MAISANVLVNTLGMDRDNWLQWRNLGIGSSEVAVVAGLSPYKSPMALYLEKIGEIEPEEAGEAAYWGTVLEDVVAKEFAKRCPEKYGRNVKVQRRNAILQHLERPYMLANVDRLIYDKESGEWGVLECKTASEYVKAAWFDESGGEAVPDSYMLQVQHQLAVTGLNWAYSAVLIGGNKYEMRYIPRDEKIIELLYTIESDFWLNHVEKKIPPAVDGSDASADLLKRMYPAEEEGKTIILPPDAERWIAQRETAKAEEKAAQARAKEADNHLKEMMGNAETALIGERKITWKTVNKKEHVVKATSYRAFNVR